LGPRAGEKLLAAGANDGGDWVVATTARLGIVREAGDVIVGEWAEVARVGLTAGTLTVEWVDGREPSAVAGLGRRHRRLTSNVQERVTASVVAARHVALSGGTVRVALRRDPANRVFTQVIAPPGADLDSQAAAEAIAEAQADLREAAGLEP
jgi:hypothetical protein